MCHVYCIVCVYTVYEESEDNTPTVHLLLKVIHLTISIDTYISIDESKSGLVHIKINFRNTFDFEILNNIEQVKIKLSKVV